MAGSTFANLMLLFWIPLGIIAGQLWTAPVAVTVLMVGGVILLPERVGFDLPLFLLDKDAISALAAFVGCLVLQRQPSTSRAPTRASTYLAAVLLAGTTLTMLTNGELIRAGGDVMPGLTSHDVGTIFMLDLFQIVLPYHLGQMAFRSTKDLQVLVSGLLLGALFYVPLVVLEARLSPFLHERFYGFFQHEFNQAKREGGFRAFVFMQHGLAVAFFMSQAFTIALALLPMRVGKLRIPRLPTLVVLGGTVVLCKSLGALGYALLTVLIFLGPVSLHVRWAKWLGIGVLVYPLLRLADLIPNKWFVAQVMKYNVERAGSFEFRVFNEEMLLARVREKWWFGWGNWGRNRVYDPVGNDMTVVDGEWIAQLGSGGFVRFATYFGFLLVPILLAGRAVKQLPPADGKLIALCALLLAFAAVEMIPNSIWSPLPFLLAGAINRVRLDLGAASSARS